METETLKSCGDELELEDEDSEVRTEVASTTESRPVEDERFGMHGGILNLGFRAEFSGDEVVDRVERSASDMQATSEAWHAYLQQVKANCDLLHEQVTHRVRRLAEQLEENGQRMHAQIDDFIDSQVAVVEDTLDVIQQKWHQILTSQDHMLRMQDDIVDEQDTSCLCFPRSVPVWRELQLSGVKTGSGDDSLPFGELCCAEVPVPELYALHVFSVRSQYDREPCGIADSCVTAEHLLVVDRNNRCLKILDLSGRFVQLAARHHLFEPVRVTFLQASRRVAVCDTCCVQLLDERGAFLRTLKTGFDYPAGLVETLSGHIAILEFRAKRMLLIDPDRGVTIRSFQLGLDSPSHVTCTPRGHLVLSDWRQNALHAYRTNGDLAWSSQSSPTASPTPNSTIVHEIASRSVPGTPRRAHRNRIRDDEACSSDTEAIDDGQTPRTVGSWSALHESDGEKQAMTAALPKRQSLIRTLLAGPDSIYRPEHCRKRNPDHLYEPHGMAPMPSGDVIVADTRSHSLKLYNQDGIYRGILVGRESPVRHPVSVNLTGDRTLYVCCQNGMVHIYKIK